MSALKSCMILYVWETIIFKFTISVIQFIYPQRKLRKDKVCKLSSTTYLILFIEILFFLDILNKVRSLCPDLLNLFEISQQDNKQEEIDSVVSVVQKKLCELNELVQGVLNNFENNVDLEKLIEIELKEMDIAIEDAASKIIDLISKTRENDNKIKLEVNEKILEACTSLMECIKVLIFKSRVLQREIVSSQKGKLVYK